MHRTGQQALISGSPRIRPNMSLPLERPLGPFAGLAAARDGTVFIAADGEGSILRLRADGG